MRESWLAKARPSSALTRSPSKLYFITVFDNGDLSQAAKGTSCSCAVGSLVAGVGLALGFTATVEAQGTSFGRPMPFLTGMLTSEVES